MTRYRPGRLRMAILLDLEEHGPARVPSMRRRLSVSNPRTLEVSLARLADEGIVRRPERGVWVLTGAGRAELARLRTLLCG